MSNIFPTDKILQRADKEQLLKQKGIAIWFTGLSGSGKTTIAKSLMEKFKTKSVVPVMLDGDEIRQAIRQSGYDRESRRKHNLNVGFIASLFEKQGNIVIVALISPCNSVQTYTSIKLPHMFLISFRTSS